ncbi:MAG: response regulator [Alphaproteobacteria bacterium]|nr:response regulator [Alphaproteobacteria bacterium]MBV8411047.1 response regulator [Alphaproteobacteria bacterium]
MRERWPDLRATTILVVEDEFLVAEDIAQLITTCGGLVVGPVASVEQALGLLAHDAPCGAILDAFLQADDAVPIAERLRALEVPFVVVTGYDCDRLPEGLRAMPCIGKPYEPHGLMQAIFGAIESKHARR